MVILARNVTIDGASNVCAFHDHMIFNGTQIVTAMVHLNDTSCSLASRAGTSSGWTGRDSDYSPHGNVAIDLAASNLVHEIMEAVTDPINFTGWSRIPGSSSIEVADICDNNGSVTGSPHSATILGPVTQDPTTGIYYNQRVGPDYAEYTIAQIWQNTGGSSGGQGYCTQSNP